MNKIILIIQREYLSRVKKKSFLLVTFIVPFVFMGGMAGIVYLGVHQDALSEKNNVEVVDESGWFVNKLKEKENLKYIYVNDNYVDAKAGFVKSKYDYLLYIPNNLEGIQLFGQKKPSTMTEGAIRETLNSIAQSHRLADAHIDSIVLSNVQKPIEIEAKQLTEKGEKKAHIVAALVVGLFSAFLIYLTLILYGVQVMRGVLEEKVNRIVEVIISSVKPFQLMLGKIIGVGLVGLTQFLLWIVVSVALSSAGGAFFSQSLKNNKTVQTSGISQHSATSAVKMETKGKESENMYGELMENLESIPVVYTICCFLFYFLFGYFLYSAIFAAVGSAVDSETETQQFVFPITLPLIFTFTLAQTVIINNPDSPLSVWLSIIPFTSPIAMMIRIPFGVPNWQLAVSMVSMVLTFLLVVWLAGRIYRVGILMYGKKASYRELAKWITYKN